MTNKKSRAYSIFAGVLFLFVGIFGYIILPIKSLFFAMWNDIDIVTKLSYPLHLISYITIGIIHLIGKYSPVRMRLMAILNFLCPAYLMYQMLEALSLKELYPNATGLVIFYVLEILAFVLLSVVYLAASSRLANKFYKLIIPMTVCAGICYILSGASMFSLTFVFLYKYVMLPAAFVFSGLWIKDEIAIYGH